MIMDAFVAIFRWGLHKVGLQALIGLSLLWLALGSLALGLSGIVQDLPLNQALLVCLLGTIMAWFAARKQLTTLQAGLGLVLIGFGWILLQAGDLWGPMFAVLRGLVSSIRLGDIKPVQQALLELQGNGVALLGRLWTWGMHISSAEQTFDPLVIQLVWSLSLWMASIWAAWVTRRRRQPLLALAPAGVLLAGSINYERASALVLVPFLEAALLLMAQTNHARREESWKAKGIDFSEDVRSDLGFWSIVAAGLIVLLAAGTPTISIHKLTSWIRDLVPQESNPLEPLARSLGLEPQSPGLEPWGTLATGSLPRSYMLGAGPELKERIVMRIRTGELAPGLPNALAHPSAFYWRAATLDFYTGSGWATSPAVGLNYAANKAALPANRANTSLVHQSVEILANPPDKGLPLYTAGDLISADQEYWIDWRSTPNKGPEADYFGAWLKSNRYQAESRVSSASIAELRRASQDYPEWIRSHYLELPPELPARVRQLAQDLTAGQPTPFDGAKAIESYLRQFPYSLDVPAPPAGREVTDYFLFELKRGYCDYYATSMVVLVRAAGIPARFAMGYASGSYDSEQAEYVVREADAHSWPEIYFPEYGWVNFEPTASLPEIDRPAQNLTNAQGTPGAGGELTGPPPLTSRFGWLLLAILALALMITGITIWQVADTLRLRWMDPGIAIQTIFGRMKNSSRAIRLQGQPGDTPFEFARRLGGRLRELQHENRWKQALSDADQQVAALSEIYAAAAYSPRAANKKDKHQAIQNWRRLKRQLLLARLFQRLNILIKKP